MVPDAYCGFVSQGRRRGRRHKTHQSLTALVSRFHFLPSSATTVASFLLIILAVCSLPSPTLAQQQEPPQSPDPVSKDSPLGNKNNLKKHVNPLQNDSPHSASSSTHLDGDSAYHQNDSPHRSGTHFVDEYHDDSWTFSNPGLSYMDFSPKIRDDQGQHYSLEFRTLRPNGLILQQHIPGLEGTPMSAVLKQYQIFLELRQGSLRAGFIMNRYQDFITAGKALNNDAWHSVELVVDVRKRELRLSLDGESTRETLKAYTWGNAEDILMWSHLKAVVSLGASRMKGSNSQVGFEPFVGCLRSVEYARPEGYLTRPTFNITEGVTPGCVDRCVEDRSCGPGRCINQYVPGVLCDCYGTDLEGPRCDLEATTTVTFRGYEWVNYQLYQQNTGRLFTDNLRISLDFKTERGSGVLLYAVGGSPYHTHVTVSIHSGAVHVSVSFQEDDLTFSKGIGLDDGRWHNLTVQHRQDKVTIYLDGLSTVKRVSKGDHYLSLDPGIFIGGGDNFVETKGLPVTQNFVGCLRNVYINEVSVLYELSQASPRSVYNGGQQPRYGCHTVAEVPISFPRSSSMLRWSGRGRRQTLTVEFKLRTFQRTSIAMFVELVGADYGSIQLWIVDRYPVLQFIPAASNELSRQNLTVDLMVSDGQLHDVHVTLNASKVTLKVDGTSAHSRRYHSKLESRGSVILGYSFDQIDRQFGFIGCMQGIKIQGQRLDAIALMESDDAVGLILDGCQLVDHCAENNICEHESVCLSDWDGIHCLCSDDHYEGKACHFAKYASSCEEYYRMGYRTNGIYLIDVDGAGPLTHTHVQCEMGDDEGSGRSRRRALQRGVTSLEHNFESNTTVRAPWLPDVQYHLKYREMSRAHLVRLTEISGQCEQYLDYGCQNAPIQLSHKTWFKSTTGEIVDYIGSHMSGYCACPPHTGCDGEHCYCDLGRDGYLHDRGYNTERRQLPIMEMTFIQDKPPGIAHMTLGPLRCWGNSIQSMEHSVTVTQAGNFLKLSPWRTGDLRLNFKTHAVNSVLLYQADDQQAQDYNSPENDIFYVTIDTLYAITVYIHRGKYLVSRYVRAPRPLGEGTWHSLVIEWDRYNLRVSIDSTRVMFDLPAGFWAGGDNRQDGELAGNNLYLGGLPDRVPVRQLGLAGMKGFTGCLYGLVYNDAPVNLPSLVDLSMSGVSKGCMSSCWPNPCQNGGLCQENWVSYTCRCSNPWAHMGDNCEIDITKDAVTFSGLPGSSLLFELSDKQPLALSATVVLSFRSFEPNALLFYAHDHLGNFVQLELDKAYTVVVTFNNQDWIVREAVRTDEPLNDGEWKQVVAETFQNFTRLMVQGHSKVVEVRRSHLLTYKLDPFTNSDEQTVFMARSSRMPSPFLRAYVGGIKDGASTTSALTGCVRGVRVGNFVFPLQDAAKSLKNDTLVAPVCDKGCQPMACHNNGFCVERWRDGQFRCNCDKSGFSGQRCEIEPSVLLKGSTVVRHTFQLPLSERYSSNERLSFRFKADHRRPEFKDKHIVLVYIASSKQKDFVMIKFLESGKIRLVTNQGSTTFRMDVDGQFEDGQPHDFSYMRDGSSMHVKVDTVQEIGINYPDYPLNTIDTIYIGGYVSDSLGFIGLANFSGCISNTAFIPKAGALERTLHTLRDLHIEEEGISVLGDPTSVCSTSQDYLPTSAAPPTPAYITPGSFMESTMPPWKDSELRIVTLSAVPSRVPGVTSAPLTPFTTSTKRSRNDTYPVLFNTTREPVGDITIIIAVIVVALLLIISLCLILVLVRMRKRRGDYLVKKEKNGADGSLDRSGKEADMELRQPLNNHHTNMGASTGSSRGSPAPTSPSGGAQTATLRRVIHPPTVPNNHLAKLDEFSMISVALGPRVPKEDTHPPDEAKKRYGEGNLPVSDGEMEFISPIYNARKQRPASSISEVLEEMERRQTPLPNGSPERPGRLHGEGDLEWDSQADASAPLRSEDEAMMRAPLLPVIPDDLEESRLSSFSGHVSSSLAGDSTYQKCVGQLETSSSPAGSSQMNSTAECNGDSGYEAESRREATEDDITPETLGDDIADLHLHPDRPPKLYSFMVPDLRVDPGDGRSPAGIFTDPSYDGGFLDHSSSGGGDLFHDNSMGRAPFKNSNSSGLLMEESPELSRMNARERLLQEGTEV